MSAPVPVGALRAIEAMPSGSEAQDYAYELCRAYPGKIADLYNAVFHNTWDVHSRKRDEERFAGQILEMKACNCIVCLRNGPVDNLILDSPQTQGHFPCNHFCCTECWEQLAARSDPDAAEVPCPMCRGDVKEYLASQHPEEMQAAPPSAMDTDSAPSGQDIALVMMELLEHNTRLRSVLRTMSGSVREDLDEADVCGVCGDTWHCYAATAGSYCDQCGDSFCQSCAEQHLTSPADLGTHPCCAICASNGTDRPYTPWSTLL
jgi:hypothetical protein